MKKKYTINEFNNLSFDDKCYLLETLLPEEYFHGQSAIKFYFPTDFNEGTGTELPETPPDIKKKEDEQMNQLIERLTDQLFETGPTIEIEMSE